MIDATDKKKFDTGAHGERNQAGQFSMMLPVCIVLAFITFWVYYPVIHHPFCSYDDTTYIVENSKIHSGLTIGNVEWAFRTFHASNWHPVTWLSHMMDVELFGLNPAGHHLSSLLFHIANSLLLFVFLSGMTKEFAASFLVAALFALHPLHVESVAWISERKDVLSTFWGLLSLGCYVKYSDTKSLPAYFMCVIFFSLGLLSKPMLVTLPFVFLLLDYWPLKRLSQPEDSVSSHVASSLVADRSLIYEKIPFFLLVFLSCSVTFAAQHAGGAIASIENISFFERFANAMRAYISYLYNSVWPFNLAVFYPFNPDFSVLVTLSSFLFLLSVCVWGYRQRENFPWLMVGWFWCWGTLVPVIGLVQVGDQAMADRYMYIPSIGLFLIVVWGGRQMTTGDFRLKKFLPTAIMLTLLLMALNTRVQLRYWKDDHSLFSHALAVTERNFTAHFHLGAALERSGDIDGAIFHYQKGLDINVNDPRLQQYMANAKSKKGNLPEAILFYRKILRMTPDNAQAHNNLGLLVMQQGKAEQALEQFRIAAELEPGYQDAARNQLLMERLFASLQEKAEGFAAALQKDSGKKGYELPTILEITSRKKDLVDEMDRYFRAVSTQPGFQPGHIDFDNMMSLERVKKTYVTSFSKFFDSLTSSTDRAAVFYHLSCIHALRNELEHSIAAMEKAVKAGFLDCDLMMKDSDLDSIRGRGGLQKLCPRELHEEG